MNIKERWRRKSPKIFRKITNICGLVVVIGTTITMAPVALPVGLVSLGGYLITAGTVGGLISKITVI